MLNRRNFLIALAAGVAARPAAAEDRDFLKNLMDGIQDRREREWFERNRNEGRWDGHYFYDRHDGRRYTRDEWRREMRRRYKEERAGRDWRKERDRRDRRDRHDDRRDRRDDRHDRRDRRDDRRDRRDDRRDRRDGRRD